jgi:hypothetical protein
MGIAVLYNWDHCEPGAGVADSCFCDVADLQSVCAFHRALYAWIWITLWLLVQGVFILSIFFVVVRLISHQMSVSKALAHRSESCLSNLCQRHFMALPFLLDYRLLGSILQALQYCLVRSLSLLFRSIHWARGMCRSRHASGAII